MSKYPVLERTDVLPSTNPKNPGKYNKTWGLQSGEGEEDLAGNPCNHPVSLRKGKEPVNGWQTVVGDVYSTDDADKDND